MATKNAKGKTGEKPQNLPFIINPQKREKRRRMKKSKNEKIEKLQKYKIL